MTIETPFSVLDNPRTVSGSLSFYSLFVEMEKLGIKTGDDPVAKLIDAIINPPEERERGEIMFGLSDEDLRVFFQQMDESCDIEKTKRLREHVYHGEIPTDPRTTGAWITGVVTPSELLARHLRLPTENLNKFLASIQESEEIWEIYAADGARARYGYIVLREKEPPIGFVVGTACF